MPVERALNEQERLELSELFTCAVELVPLPEGVDEIGGADPGLLVAGVREVVEAVRAGAGLPVELEADDLAVWLGALWGDELCRVAGWEWAHLAFENGLATLAVVAPDRTHACLPFHFLYGLLTVREMENTVVALFDAVREGRLPPAEEGGYALLG